VVVPKVRFVWFVVEFCLGTSSKLVCCVQKVVELFLNARKLFVHFPNTAHGKLNMLFVDLFKSCRIWKGKDNYLGFIPEEPLDFTALVERGNQLSWETELEEPIVAPIYAGQKLGSLVLYDSLGELKRVALVASQNAERGGFFKRLFDSIRLFLNKIFHS